MLSALFLARPRGGVVCTKAAKILSEVNNLDYCRATSWDRVDW